MTVKTREVIIWFCFVLVGLPLGWLLFKDFSFFVGHSEMIVAIVLILSLAVSGWRLKKGLKRRMRQGLGREVDDSELTSITTWIRIPEEATKAAKEAEKYNFDRNKR